MSKYRLAAFLLIVGTLLWLSQAATLSVWRISGGDYSARVATEKLVQQLAGVNLITLDLAHLRMRLLQLPGVAEVRLYRRFPDALAISLSPRQPLAVWENGGLVDVRGRRYEGVATTFLPIFRGPEKRAASMADFYAAAAGILLPLNTPIIQLEVDAVGEWRVFLQDSVVLHLGRDNRHERLRRYVRYASALRRRFVRLRAVDLRYETGFSVIGERKEEEV